MVILTALTGIFAGLLLTDSVAAHEGVVTRFYPEYVECAMPADFTFLHRVNLALPDGNNIDAEANCTCWAYAYCERRNPRSEMSSRWVSPGWR